MAFLDGYQFIVYAGCFACLLLLRKKATTAQLLPVLVVVGGFLFHLLLWEAKSQYAMPYVLLCLPMCARGLVALAEKLPAGVAWVREMLRPAKAKAE